MCLYPHRLYFIEHLLYARLDKAFPMVPPSPHHCIMTGALSPVQIREALTVSSPGLGKAPQGEPRVTGTQLECEDWSPSLGPCLPSVSRPPTPPFSAVVSVCFFGCLPTDPPPIIHTLSAPLHVPLSLSPCPRLSPLAPWMAPPRLCTQPLSPRQHIMSLVRA